MPTQSRDPPAGWRVHRVEADLRVVVERARPELTTQTQQAVDRCWQEATGRNPALFNGAVFSVDHITPGRLGGHWTEYRRILAQHHEPTLATILDVRPLAVAGLIEGPDGIVLGRRPAGAVYQPGLWQLAPAGNVDAGAATGAEVDVNAALATELREELGLPAEALAELRPVCLVQHPGIGVLDLCIAARTALRAAAIHEAHARLGDGEYPEIAVVPRAGLPAFLARHGNGIAPQVRLFLSAAYADGGT